MDYNELRNRITEEFDKLDLDYCLNKRMEYRCSYIDVDIYIPERKEAVFIEKNDYMHEVYLDFKHMGDTLGYTTVIIPQHALHNEEEAKKYINLAQYPTIFTYYN